MPIVLAAVLRDSALYRVKVVTALLRHIPLYIAIPHYTGIYVSWVAADFFQTEISMTQI